MRYGKISHISASRQAGSVGGQGGGGSRRISGEQGIGCGCVREMVSGGSIMGAKGGRKVWSEEGSEDGGVAGKKHVLKY